MSNEQDIPDIQLPQDQKLYGKQKDLTLQDLPGIRDMMYQNGTDPPGRPILVVAPL